MTDRERKLIGVLGWTALLCACALVAASGLERLREVSSSIERYQAQWARLEARASEDPAFLEESIRELADIVQRLEERKEARSTDAKNPAEFGTRVREALRVAGLSVLRYQGGAPDSGEMEFSARGSPLALAKFLLSAAAEAWTIPFLSIRTESASLPLELTFRIRHGR